MKYDAFISYRHAPLDMEIAKKVHTGLETYKIPGAVQKKTGKKKMGRVFRDQEELPIGSDLGDNISSALEESEYLLVICSPRTPDSYWVCKEIETFIRMHDRQHVLAILIEGEPDESFPPLLLTDENGNPVEPLAADVRGDNKKERNQKFKTEILRLAAPIIGCSYDDLKQRHKERMIKRLIVSISAAAGIVAAAGTAFGIYNANVADRMKKLADEKAALADEKAALADEKAALADEITVQYKGKQENQSRFFAQEALSLLDQGNREDAVLVAMEGLPSDGNERPYVAESEYALSRALYAYDSGNTLSVERNLSHDLSVKTLERTEDGKKLLTIDSGNSVYVWDSSDWKRLATIRPAVNSSNYYDSVNSADADDSGVYVANDERLDKYDYDGKLLYSIESEDYIRQCNVCEDSGKLYLVKWGSVDVLDPKDGSLITTIENTTGVNNIGKGKYYPDASLFAFAHYDSDIPDTYISIINTKDDTCKDVKISGGYFLELCATQNGNIAVLSCNQDLLTAGVTYVAVDLIDPKGNIIWTKELDVHVKYTMTFNSIIKAHSYEEDGKKQSDIVVTFEAEAFTIEEESGQLKAEFNLSGDVNLLALSTGNSWGRVGYRQGNIDVVDFAEGRIYSDYSVETADSVRDGVVLDNVMAYTSYKSKDVHVLTWHEAYDIEDFAKTDDSMSIQDIAADCSYYAMHPSMEFNSLVFFDTKGKELYSFDEAEFIVGAKFYADKAYIADRSCIWVIDPFGKKCEKIEISDYNKDLTINNVYFSDDGPVCVLWDSWDVLVLDLASKKSISSFSTENIIGSIILSKDNKSLYVVEGGENLYIWDIIKEERAEFKDDNLQTVAGSFEKEFMTLSPDGAYLAICCMDGYLRILDTKSLETYARIPFQTYLSAFTDFTDDGSCLVVQGDDYRIRIWDMKDKTFKNTMDASASVSRLICDEDSSLMAVCTGYGIYLYETGNYGCVGYAEDGILYLKEDDSILLSTDGKTIKKCHYKDYKELMQEAGRQFPDAALTEEKRAMYNVDESGDVSGDS